MKHRIILFAVALVAGCTSQEQVARESAIPPYPDPYRAALQQEFLLLADREAGRSDHADAKRFLARAEEVARAVRVRPLPIEAYDVVPERLASVQSARAQLLPLFDGGRARAPQALAKAHGAYECWLEESEEGHQSDAIAWCRERFHAAVAETRRLAGLDADWGVVLEGDDGEVGAITVSGEDGGETLLDQADAGSFVNEGDAAKDARMTAREQTTIGAGPLALMPPAAKRYVVYFASGSDRLDAAADAAIAEAVADAAQREAVDVEIIGFADRAGEDRANLALSQRRAERVRTALAAGGVPEDAFLVYARGEDESAVLTADGAAEARNRRAEITVR